MQYNLTHRTHALNVMIALCLACALGVTGAKAQPLLFYDEATQGLVSWPGGQITAEATSNIGQFIISASDGKLKLMGNSGEVVAQTNAAGQTDPDGDGDNDLIYDGPIALATNHNSDAAIVQTTGSYGNGVFGDNTFTASNGAHLFDFPTYNGSYYYQLQWPVTENNWSPAINSSTSQILFLSDPNFHNVQYHNIGASTHADIAFECGGGFFPSKGKGQLPMSELHDTSVHPDDSDYLYWAALDWWGIDWQKAIDTERLFIERHPYYQYYIPSAFRYDGQMVGRIAEHDSFYDYQPFIDDYNWKLSVFNLDTAQWYQAEVLFDAASDEIMFDRNGAANLMWNIEQRYPFWSGSCTESINAIRDKQSEIPEDTTPFQHVDLPPSPYEASIAPNSASSGLTLTAVPNPANESMTAYINTSYSAPAALEIYDELGQRVESLPSPRLQSGNNQFTLDCSKLAAGNYYLRLASGGTVKTIRIEIEH